MHGGHAGHEVAVLGFCCTPEALQLHAEGPGRGAALDGRGVRAAWLLQRCDAHMACQRHLLPAPARGV